MVTYWLYGHGSEEGDPLTQSSTCIQNFHPSPEVEEEEEEDVGGDLKYFQDRKSIGKSGKRSEWVTQISKCSSSIDDNNMQKELPSYEDIENEFKNSSSPPIVQLKEGYHF